MVKLTSQPHAPLTKFLNRIELEWLPRTTSSKFASGPTAFNVTGSLWVDETCVNQILKNLLMNRFYVKY